MTKLLPNVFQNQMIDFHRQLLADVARTDAFRRSINQSIKTNDIVADIGTGSAILSLFAAKAGAQHVFAIESNPFTAAFAKRVVKNNGLESRITVIEADSLHVQLPTKVDVVISECIGWMMYFGNMFSTVADARERFLKAGGVVIPRSLKLFAVPIQSDAVYLYSDLVDVGNIYGFNLSGCAPPNEVFRTTISEDSFVAHPALLAAIDLVTGYPSEMINKEVTFTVLRTSKLHGFGLWFDADLCEGVELSTAPDKPQTAWQQTFIGCGGEVLLQTGDTITLQLQLARSLESLHAKLNWSLSIRRGGNEIIAKRRFDTAEGLFADQRWTTQIDGQEWLRLKRGNLARIERLATEIARALIVSGR